MTPEERQLLAGLFDRIREQANAPRDGEAEAFIADAVRQAPYASYLMAQTVIVQDHALQGANQRLQQLEAQLRELESAQTQAQPGGASFLGNIGKSLFGERPSAPRPAFPAAGPWAQTAAPQPPPQPSYSAPAAAAWGSPVAPAAPPWGAAPQATGGFLKGALGAAAGVAGGVLLADSIRGLFSHGGNPYGIASGFTPGGFGNAGETVINNNYDSGTDPQSVQGADYPVDDGSNIQNASDDSGDWSNSDPGDDTFNA